MEYVIAENQLKDLLRDAMAENPDTPKEDIIQWIINNPDIKIMTGSKYGEAEQISSWSQGKTPDELMNDFNIDIDDSGAVKESNDVSREDRLKYSDKYETNKYQKIWNDAIKDIDDTDPLMTRAQKIVDGYRQLWDEKNKITSDYNSGASGDKEVYQKKLDNINTALEKAEKSPEFKSIVDTIRDGGGASTEDKLFNPMISSTLEQMAMGMGSRTGNKIGASTENWLLGDYANSNFRRLIAAIPGIGANKGLDKLPEIYDANIGGGKKNKDSKGNDKSNDFYGPADGMKFGSDIDGSEGEGYLDKRNDQLAEHLAKKGIESREDINTFLSKYSSWVNAKDKWKENTLDELTKRIEKINPKKEETNKEDKKEDKEKDKEVFDKDSWVWKKDEDGYWNPNDDSPINGVEDSDKSYGDKSDKDSPINEVEQTPENNKYLYINETVKNLGSDKERIDYLKKHGFVVDKKTGYFTKNGMKTKVYKDGQYSPKYVKPDKKEGYNDRTVVEPSKKNDFQIALQESGYKGPRDAKGNFLPITDEWLDTHENLKGKDKK